MEFSAKKTSPYFKTYFTQMLNNNRVTTIVSGPTPDAISSQDNFINILSNNTLKLYYDGSFDGQIDHPSNYILIQPI